MASIPLADLSPSTDSNMTVNVPAQHSAPAGAEGQEAGNHPAAQDDMEPPTAPPPDRGWPAWLAVISGFIQLWASFGILNSWGSFQAVYVDEPWSKGVKLQDIGWIGSVQPGLLFVLGGIAGYASDRLSATVLMMIGTCIFSAAFLLLAEFGDGLGTYIALQGFLYGLANTLLYYPILSVVSTWFDRRRGLALGIVASGSSLGGIFWPLVVDALNEAFGLKRTLQAVGLIPLVPLFIASFMVKERFPDTKITLRRAFRRLTQRFTNAEKKSQGNTTTTLLATASTTTGTTTPGALNSLKDPSFIALSIALFFIYGGMLIPFNLIPVFAEEHHHADVAHVLLAICYSGSVVGRIGTGALADYFGTFNMLCLMALLTATLTACWVTMTSLPAMIAFAVLYGLFSGGLIPLGSACVAKITPPEQIGQIGLRLGFTMMVCSISAFGGGPLSNFLLEGTGQSGWLAACLFSGMATLVGGGIIFAILVSRIVRGGQGYKF
ncbi:major facilitator superfamily domain-containing protein [Emericellopsis atlantica]|uniref:Major facilitator superfamily domain-containing protein n=1 Tax=Emericellopsis atlantica TaxID=2614577 RepID=A0A9P8CLV9_9HYPO|nr:major facilitator superfamily domain-containing protein [Emericellopsis atlantica]KAG9252044.1 major facilitator superfamily domain-containing protein [Emericellopsis atlantica]